MLSDQLLLLKLKKNKKQFDGKYFIVHEFMLFFICFALWGHIYLI